MFLSGAQKQDLHYHILQYAVFDYANVRVFRGGQKTPREGVYFFGCQSRGPSQEQGPIVRGTVRAHSKTQHCLEGLLVFK